MRRCLYQDTSLSLKSDIHILDYHLTHLTNNYILEKQMCIVFLVLFYYFLLSVELGIISRKSRPRNGSITFSTIIQNKKPMTRMEKCLNFHLITDLLNKISILVSERMYVKILYCTI